MDYTYLRYIYELLQDWYAEWQTWIASVDLPALSASVERIAFYAEGLLVLLIVYMFGRIYRAK